MAIAVDLKCCPQNHPCPALKVCPVGALSQKDFNAPVVDAAKCIDCKKCVRFCPMKAFS
jgi:ferredoxin